jgi:pyridoxine 5-phosphate synthase
MPVFIRSEVEGLLPFALKKLQRKSNQLLQICGHSKSELSILLVSDPRMRELNLRYRKRNKPTNVLSFPLAEKPAIQNGIMLGDIVLSIDTVQKEAQRLRIPPWERTVRLLVHGLVHLLGYDHERSDGDAIEMEQQEKIILEKLESFHRRINMPHLAINVDHIATLRQARGTSEPDPVLAAGICELAGASGIVVHLREDRRHIVDRDVHLLRQTIKTKLNLEMGATEEIIKIALEIKPDMVTLVPEKRQELTTEGGLDVVNQTKKLAKTIARMTKKEIPVSLFIDPDPDQIRASLDVGATFVEIHTGRYCDAETEQEREKEFAMVADAAEEAFAAGLRVNAGHGLNYLTTSRVAALDAIEELSIGHAVISRAAFVGLDRAVREMLALMKVS